jgi:hypothetical protein
MGCVRITPIPAVNMITGMSIMNITTAAVIEEYSSPSGPKSNARMMASPVLLVDATMITG